MSVIWTIAITEARLLLRSRWVAAYSLALACLALAVCFVSLRLMAAAGFSGFERTAASLLGLVLFVVPLAAMLTAVPAFSDGQGLYRQLLCEPVPVMRLVAGKVLGLALANGLAILTGFSLSGIYVGWQAGLGGLGILAQVTLVSLIVAVAYIAIAALLTVISGRNPRAYIAVLVVLFVSIILLDLLLMGLGMALPAGYANRVAFAGLFLNPADAARAAGLLAIGGGETLGVAAVMLTRSLGGELQAICLLLLSPIIWTAAATGGTAWLLQRQDS